MSADIIVFIIVIAVIVLFTLEVFTVEITALLVMTSLMVTEVLTPQEAVSGFSNSAALTVLAMLIISAALQDTGIISYLGQKTIRLKVKSELVVMGSVMILSGLISAFINNTAVVAIFLPMIIKTARQKDMSANKLLMALSFGAMLGGSCTLVGSSTNLLVSDIAKSQGFMPLQMFELSAVGGLLFAAQAAFLVFIGHHFITTRRKKASDLTEDFQLQEYLAEILVTPGSELVGKNLHQTGLAKNLDVEILQIVRDDDITYLPENVEVVKENDVLIIKTNAKKIMELHVSEGLEFRTGHGQPLHDDQITEKTLQADKGALVEVIISPNSKLVQKRVEDVPFRAQYHAIPLAIRRKSGLTTSQLRNVRLEVGYSLLLETTRDDIEGLYASEDFIIVKEYKRPKLKKDKAIISVGIVIGVVLFASLNIVPILVSAWVGCVALFLTRCIEIQKVYGLIDWRIYFLLAGIIPLGLAVEKSGAGEIISIWVLNYLADFGPTVVLSILFLITVLLSAYISNNAVAVLIAPIAIGIAVQMNLDPRPFLLAVIFAANSSFLTPIGYQTNTMIYGAGQFKFKDFLLTGGLMTLIAWILVSIFIPLIYF